MILYIYSSDALKMIKRISKELFKGNIYHKIKENKILTRRSNIKIPLINEDIFYLLGVVEGDGSLIKSKRKRGGYHYVLRIYSGEKKYLIYLNEIIQELFGIKGRITKDKRKNSSYCIIIQNATIFFYFVILGSEIGKKKIGNISKTVRRKNKNILHYLAGLVDTDGHISNKRIQLKQKRHQLLKEIKELSNQLNLNCSDPKINYTNQIPFYYIRFDNKLPLRWKTKNLLN